MPWLSILVPVYNVQAYLQECLASIIEQLKGSEAGDGVEILVLDDRSTDDSWALMQQLAARWPGRLQLLQHDRNGGLSAARNTMIAVARGDYLWFLDSDDKLLPGSIERLRTIVQTHAPDVVLCDFQVWRERERLKHRLRGERHRTSFHGPRRQPVHDRCALLAGMLSTGELHAWSKISRRALWGDDLRFPVGRHFEDMATMPLMALRAESFYYEPSPWVAYRQRAGSILASMNAPKAMDQSAALLPLAQALQSSPCGKDGAVQLALAQQAARSFVGAMRALQKTGDGSLRDTVRSNFLQASPLTPQALARAFFWRGWWLRRQRFLRWFRGAS